MSNKNIENLVRPNIRVLAPYASAREEYTGKSGIFLDANENPFGAYNRYPDPYQNALKQRLAELKNISTEHIFVGNGSDEVIDLAFRIFCEPNKDKALTFSPSYGMYEVSAAINGTELIKLPLTPDFRIDLDKLKPYLADKQLKLIFICSPNNPTGNLLNANDIEYILANFDGIVIIDEAYIDFCPQASFIHKIAQYGNLIVSQTLSKAWASAGLRIGMAYMDTPILAYFNKVKAPYNVSIPCQEKALEVLQNENEFNTKRDTILAERDKLVQALGQLQSVKKIYPSDANFILVEVNDANATYSALTNLQIIVRNRHGAIPNCLRITVGSPQENEQLLNALKSLENAR